MPALVICTYVTKNMLIPTVVSHELRATYVFLGLNSIHVTWPQVILRDHYSMHLFQRRQDMHHYCIICLHTSLYSIRIVVHVYYTKKAWLNASWRISPSYSRDSDRLSTWFRETWWVFVPRPLIVLLTLVLCMRDWVDTTSARLSSSFVQSLPGHWNRGVYKQEAWNDASPVGTVYLQLDSVCDQLIGGVVARLCQARGALLARTDLHGLLPKKKPEVRGVSSDKSVDQWLTFLLSKNYLCTIMLTLWNSCIVSCFRQSP